MNEQGTILAVDDTPESLALLVETLTAAGYKVLPADSGELALAAVAANPPELILLDVRMKGMDGLEVCRQLKAREETRHIPIILISAFADVKEWVEGLQLGAADYITKPFRFEELLTRVKTHMTLGRANASLEQQAHALIQANEQLQSESVKRQRVEAKLRVNLDRAERSRRAMLSSLEDSKRAGERIQHLNRVLLRGITESRRIEMEVLRKSRDLETMLYVASHDLREPLRGIRTFARLVVERCQDQLDEKGRDYLARVLRAGARMDQLMEDILAISRAGRVITPGERCCGDELVRQALAGLTDRANATGAKIVISGQFADLLVDSTWAVLAIQNLVVNALKFTRDGEAPEIEIGPCSRTIDGSLTHGVEVRDRGIGVSAEHAERIFQLFQRAVGRDVEGTGAGLAIVHQIAERHRGTAWVEPREGGGSIFRVTFGRAWSGSATPPDTVERNGDNANDAES